MKVFFVTLLLTLPIYAKNDLKLKVNLTNAKTNLEMKKISKEITKSFEKKMKITIMKIKKNLKGEQLKSFINSQKSWEKYLENEDTFLMHEFSQREKHGTSASLTSRTRKNQVIESRLNYLEALSKSL
jgi:hypothetical protein